MILPPRPYPTASNSRHWTLFALTVTLLTIAFRVPAGAQASQTATYQVRFEATWSADTHPGAFPANAHFSRLVGGVHDARVSFWQEGSLASRGIEAMAEDGLTTLLNQEIQVAIGAGTASALIGGSGIGRSPGTVEAALSVSRDFPLVTLVTMVAPSPDWFVGVAGLDLRAGGDWANEIVVQLFAWDAGTDSGRSFTSPDADTNPREPVALITEGPLSNGAALGAFTFTRQDEPPVEPPDSALELLDGRFRVTAEWQDFELDRGMGQPVALSDETGYLWFFNPGNIEVVVKLLDGCAINGRFWVFAGGLTNTAVEMRVEDTETGQVNLYGNPLGAAFQPIQDTDAFATCP